MTIDANTRTENQIGAQPKHQADTAALTVFYDGACPLCSREIAFYKKRDSLSDVGWVDVSDCAESDIATGLTRDQAIARFHVRLPDGSLSSGPRGFGEIWKRMKGVSCLGRILQIKSLQPFLESLYRGLLVLRSIAVKRMSKR